MEIYFNDTKQVFASINGFTIKTDQAVKGGGKGEFPEPFTLFLASLGTCAGIYVKGFCDQRGIDSSRVKLTQDMKFNPVKRMIDQFSIDIHVPAEFPEKYDKAVVQAASLCAVKRHLSEEIHMDVRVVRN